MDQEKSKASTTDPHPHPLTDSRRLEWMIERNGFIGKNDHAFPQVEWVIAWWDDDKEKRVECFPNCSARQAIDTAITMQREEDDT